MLQKLLVVLLQQLPKIGTFEQAEVWFEAIERNYCKKPTYSGSDINNLA